jgi:hypothetical protein
MKASIKATVAELLPVLAAREMDSDSVTGDRAADSDGIYFHPFIIFFLLLLFLMLNYLYPFNFSL